MSDPDVSFGNLMIKVRSVEMGRRKVVSRASLPLPLQLPLGRQCVEHYRLLHRYCVFSHDEMICKMASKAAVLDVVVASTVQKDMAVMVEDERALRDAVRKLVGFWIPVVCPWCHLAKFLCT